MPQQYQLGRGNIFGGKPRYQTNVSQEGEYKPTDCQHLLQHRTTGRQGGDGSSKSSNSRKRAGESSFAATGRSRPPKSTKWGRVSLKTSTTPFSGCLGGDDVVPTVIGKENRDIPNVNTPLGEWLLKGMKINKHRLVTLYVSSSLHVIINNKNLKLAYTY